MLLHCKHGIKLPRQHKRDTQGERRLSCHGCCGTVRQLCLSSKSLNIPRDPALQCSLLTPACPSPLVYMQCTPLPVYTCHHPSASTQAGPLFCGLHGPFLCWLEGHLLFAQLTSCPPGIATTPSLKRAKTSLPQTCPSMNILAHLEHKI